MDNLLYAFFIAESEAPGSSPSILNGSKTWVCIKYKDKMKYAKYKDDIIVCTLSNFTKDIPPGSYFWWNKWGVSW